MSMKGWTRRGGKAWRRGVSLVTLAIVASACTGGESTTSPAGGRAPGTMRVAAIRLYPSPRIVIEACKRAQALTSRTVLCPTLLPRPTVSSSSEPGVPPQPIGVMATDDPRLLSYGTGPGSVLLNFMYSAPYESDPSKNRPDRFLHFEVYVRGRCCGPPPEAQPAVIGGRSGLLVRAGGAGAYFYNHVRFFWEQDGIDYVATLHEFGAGTTALLGALVAGLEPTKGLAAPAVTPIRAKNASSRSIPAMTGPVAAAVAGGFVWVASIGDAASAFQTAAWPGRQTGPGLQRFDPRTLEPEGHPIRLGSRELRQLGLIRRVDWQPSGLGVGFGLVWTLVEFYGHPSTLFGLDPASGRVKARFAERIPLDEGDLTSIAAARGALWVSQYGPPTPAHRGEFGGIFEPGTVWRINPDTGHVVARILVGAGVVRVASTNNAVWAANYRDDTVSRIDPATNQVVATVPVGAGPTALAATSQQVWVANSLQGTVSRIDPATNRVVAQVSVGECPLGLARTEDGIWVTNYASDTVSKIDTGRDRVVATLHVGRGPIGITEDLGYLWITNDLDASIMRQTR
jgi:YVTN family beta-propeller protein